MVLVFSFLIKTILRVYHVVTAQLNRIRLITS